MPFPTGVPSVTFITRFRVNSLLASCSTYWELDGALSPSFDHVEMVNDYQTQFGNYWKDLASTLNAIVLTQSIYRSGTSYLDAHSTGAEIPGTVGDIPLGVDTPAPLPSWDAILLQRRTGLAGRQHRGRLFIPGIDELLQNASFVEASAYVAVGALAAFLGSDQVFNATTFHARHWNRKNNALEVITAIRPVKELATRKDRQPKGPQLTF